MAEIINSITITKARFNGKKLLLEWMLNEGKTWIGTRGVRYKLINYKLSRIGCCIYVYMYSLSKNGTEKSVPFFDRKVLILPKV